ncbi:MAG: Re/Si-specific NAD(P)(+) transhydrogenase subunit alpha [Mycobacteriales bacterium]
MRIGIPRESRPGESLVGGTAKSAAQLVDLGYEVVVEAGAGQAADQPDEAFAAAGVRVVGSADVWASDIVVKVNAPTPEEVARLRPEATVVALMAPGRSPELLEQLQEAGVTGLAMDAVPRISRAQSMDVLSSMANVAGYRAVIEAAHEFGRSFNGQVTAAGKVPPARVFVVGAGVAGLAAIGAAGSLGAVVRAFDVRPEVAEQVQSLGGQFVTVEMEQETSTDGYAKEMTTSQQAATAALYDEEARAADIVITTALIPGRPAPRLITAETVRGMRPGSVVVDMAAASGGNVEPSQPDQKVVENGVKVLGYTDLAGRLAAQTSQLYGTNIVNLFKLLTPGGDGRLVLDMDDVVQRAITVVLRGQAMWPPPPVQVSAAPPAPASAMTSPAADPAASDPTTTAPGTRTPRGVYAAALAAVLFAGLAAFSPDAFLSHFTVFVLACFVGYYVISNVAPALHTPLMSTTNAISGIILVGGMQQVGNTDPVVAVLAVIAVVFASINIFGGFLVTDRMLNMFRKA